MFIGEIIGKIGADATPTEKGFYFPLAYHYREGEEKKTLWVQCFVNYQNNVFEHVKRGRSAYVLGDINVKLSQRDPESEITPLVNMNVIRVQLL